MLTPSDSHTETAPDVRDPEVNLVALRALGMFELRCSPKIIARALKIPEARVEHYLAEARGVMGVLHAHRVDWGELRRQVRDGETLAGPRTRRLLDEQAAGWRDQRDRN